MFVLNVYVDDVSIRSNFVAMFISKHHLISLIASIVIKFSSRCSGDDGDAFEKETVETVLVEEHPFHGLTHTERKDLCFSAKKSAGLGGMDTDSFVSILAAREYTIVSKNGEKEFVIALQCPTVPVAFLLPGKSGEKIRMVLRDNQFAAKSFEPITIDPALKTFFYVPGEDSAKRKLREHIFSGMHIDDRSNLCLAAKEGTQNTPSDTGIRYVETARILEIHYPDRKERYAAIKCPIPSSNMYLISPENSRDQIKIVFIKDDPSTEISEENTSLSKRFDRLNSSNCVR